MCRSGVKTLSQNIHSTGWQCSYSNNTKKTSALRREERNRFNNSQVNDDTTSECGNDVSTPNQITTVRRKERKKLQMAQEAYKRVGRWTRKQTATAENGKIISEQMTELTSIDVFLRKKRTELKLNTHSYTNGMRKKTHNTSSQQTATQPHVQICVDKHRTTNLIV